MICILSPKPPCEAEGQPSALSRRKGRGGESRTKVKILLILRRAKKAKCGSLGPPAAHVASG
jgi:hypothetical protein